MNERPILMNSEMVRAVLEGRKTQTRRPLHVNMIDDIDLSGAAPEVRGEYQFLRLKNGHEFGPVRNPFGQPSCRLWVRETTLADHEFHEQIVAAKYAADGVHVLYSGPETHDDGEPAYGGSLAHWWYSKPACPSIHMPRWAARIILQITGVRVERVQDVTESDAMAEGIAFESGWEESCGEGYASGEGFLDYGSKDDAYSCRTAIGSYRTLWESLYGPLAWDANPWVWAVEFRRIEA